MPAFLLTFAMVHVLGALTTSFEVLLVTRLAVAVANAGFLAVALSTAATLVPAGRQGRGLRGLAVLLAGTTLATIAGVPGGAVLGTMLGWRATFWAIALLCVPAAVGIVKALPARAVRPDSSVAGASLRDELAQLAGKRLALAMLLAALVNAGTFAGRLSDTRPGIIIGIGGPALLAGWAALAVLSGSPIVLLLLAFIQGALSFAVGSTLIARVLYEAAGAPTMGGAYATAALNVGAAGGPVAAAAVLGIHASVVAPVCVSTVLIALPLLRIVAPRPGAATSTPPLG